MVLVIAEAGVNHNGDEARAMEMVDVAAESGADLIKFQTFVPDEVISIFAVKAEYQRAATGGGDSQLEMVRSLALSPDSHLRLRQYCEARRIGFLSTPFDLQSLHFLSAEMGLPLIKLPSGEITNGPLLLAAARTGRSIILSTGMSDLAEVRTALSVLAFGYTTSEGNPRTEILERGFSLSDLREMLCEKVTLLHCTSEYPAPAADLNLRAILSLREAFSLPTGLSDHSDGINAAIVATALGATVIEKHFTLDRSLTGPDHKASLEPEALKEMVSAIRETSLMLGDGEKRARPSEIKNLSVVRKSIVAARPIKQGTLLTSADLACKRPGEGISPMLYWKLLGRTAQKDYGPDELLDSALLG